MRRPLRWTVLSLLLVWLEVGPLPALGLPRFHLPLLLALATGVVYGPRQGMAVGAVAGFWLDLWTGRLVGSWTLLHALGGWAGGKAGESLYRDVPGLATALGVTATWVAELARGLVVSAAVGLPLAMADLVAWSRALWPELVAAAVAAPLLLRLVVGIERREREAREAEIPGGWRGGWP